jgi:undecaprenyl-diphosphatase
VARNNALMDAIFRNVTRFFAFLVFSLLVSALIILLAVAFGIAAKQPILDFHVAVLRLFAGLPDSVERFLIGLSQFAAVLLPVLVVTGLLALRQRRALLVLAAAGAVSAIAVAFVDHAVKHENPALEITRVKTSAWLLGAAFPSSPYIAAAAAGATVVRLFVSRRWGHALWLAVAFIAAFRLFAGANVPLDIVIAGGVGWFVGTAAALVFGAPDHRPTAHEVADSLAGCGLPVARLVPAAVDARGSTPWFATTTDGSPLFVKALGRDERDADLLFRIYRFFRLKNVGDQRPFSSSVQQNDAD